MSEVDPVLVERYARALFAVAKREGVQTEIMQQIEALQPLTGLRQKLVVFLIAPQVSTEAKAAILDKAFKGRIHPLLYEFYLMSLRKGRMDILPAAQRRFIELVENEMGIHEGRITSARDLADDQKDALQAALEKYLKVKFRLRYSVVPNLLGGVRFASGDLLIDGTVRGKLRRLGAQLEQAIRP